MSQITKATLQFLKEIKENNNKPWFEKNKPRYLSVKKELQDFVDDWLHACMSFDESLRDEHKGYQFRIYRDARFAKGRPYKNNLGLMLGKGGRRAMHEHAGYYLHIEPGNYFLAGGSYMPPKPWLNAIRQSIDESPKNIKKILNNKTFKKHFALEGPRLKTAPRDYPKDHPEIELLKYKGMVAIHYFKDKELMGDDFFDHLVDLCKMMKPFNVYLNRLV